MRLYKHELHHNKKHIVNILQKKTAMDLLVMSSHAFNFLFIPFCIIFHPPPLSWNSTLKGGIQTSFYFCQGRKRVLIHNFRKSDSREQNI